MAKDDVGRAPLAVSSGRDAQWLSDLSLRSSQHNGDNGFEAAIMRLSSYPELLHRFLNENPDPARMSAVSPANFNVFLESECGSTLGISGDRQLSRTLAYHNPVFGDDCATSLEPLAFCPTDEDTRLAIDAELRATSSGVPSAPSRKPERVPRHLIVAVALAVMIMGLLAVA